MSDFNQLLGWAVGGWRLQLVVETVLKKNDPVKVIKGESGKAGYRDAAWIIVRKLVERGHKPTKREAAWVVYGTIADQFPGMSVFDEDLYSRIADQFMMGWDFAFRFPGGATG